MLSEYETQSAKHLHNKEKARIPKFIRTLFIMLQVFILATPAWSYHFVIRTTKTHPHTAGTNTTAVCSSPIESSSRTEFFHTTSCTTASPTSSGRYLHSLMLTETKSMRNSWISTASSESSSSPMRLHTPTAFFGWRSRKSGLYSW